MDLLPEEARVRVKEQKPKSTKEAGKLAEDFRQARKESWDTASGKTKRCYNCRAVGHLAWDCPQSKCGTKQATGWSQGSRMVEH